MYHISVAQLILYVRTMVIRIGAGPDFTSPPSLASMSTAVDELEAAAKNAMNGGVHDTEVMYVKREIVENKLNVFARYVEDVANDMANIARGADVITEAGFSLKRTGGRHPFTFAVKNGEFSGSIKLTAPVVRRSSHEWQFTSTPDDAGSWIAAVSTIRASTIITELTPGTQMYFRHRVLTPEGLKPWDDPICIVVH